MAAGGLPADTAGTAARCRKECRVNDHSNTVSRPRLGAGPVGGAAMIIATLLFAAVFVQLSRSFGYPEVLDGSAAEVLPRLLSLGPLGRGVWVLYGLIPLLLVPAGLAVQALGRAASPVQARAALVLAVLAAASMTAGLLRWPSLNWQLALAWQTASPAAREALAAVFAAGNSYLGTFVGEFLGELFLNAFFALAAWMLARACGGAPRWLRAIGVLGLAASALGAVAMLRNALPGLGAIAELNNAVLPLWMLLLGVALVRHPGAGQAEAAPLMRQTTSPTSSATSTDRPSGPMATPTGRP